MVVGDAQWPASLLSYCGSEWGSALLIIQSQASIYNDHGVLIMEFHCLVLASWSDLTAVVSYMNKPSIIKAL